MNMAPTFLSARLELVTGEFLTALIKGAKIRFYSDQFNPTKMLELIKTESFP